jgi:hypothetical protein
VPLALIDEANAAVRARGIQTVGPRNFHELQLCQKFLRIVIECRERLEFLGGVTFIEPDNSA